VIKKIWQIQRFFVNESIPHHCHCLLVLYSHAESFLVIFWHQVSVIINGPRTGLCGCRGVLFVDVDVVVFVWVLLTFHCHAVFVHIFVEEF